jgi:hypothetical protein
LFAANPLGEKIFTNGAKTKNLQLQKGERITFRYRIVIDDNIATISADAINKLADKFGRVE